MITASCVNNPNPKIKSIVPEYDYLGTRGTVGAWIPQQIQGAQHFAGAFGYIKLYIKYGRESLHRCHTAK